MIARVVGLIAMGISGVAFSTILPPNDLHLEDNGAFVANISESEFMEITNKVISTYKPIAQAHGASLSVNARWQDNTVNASAQQMGTSWIVNMYGGLARRPEVTKDGYAMVICHELGHHFGGFPFSSEWAGDEGQADYFATQACAQALWSQDFELNSTFRTTVEAPAKALCDAAWTDEARQNLCYRIAMAGKSLATLLASAGRTGEVHFETPDSTQVTTTNHRHPAAQCRLDTYVSGSICPVGFNNALIPGKSLSHTSIEAEEEAYTVSCAQRDGHTRAARSRCWFKPNVM